MKLEELLIKLGFNVSTKGFNYWLEAVRMYKFDKMEDVYSFIATNNRDTRNRVERAMRVTREQANKNIKEYFNYNFRIGNKTLLHLLKLEMNKSTIYGKVKK